MAALTLTLLTVKKLIHTYQSDALVIEETGKSSRRGPRIRTLCRKLVELTERKKIRVARYTTGQGRSAFAAESAKTKPEIAKAIVARIPVFAPKFPPERKI